MIEKLDLISKDNLKGNIEKLAELFPNCITESFDDNGDLKKLQSLFSFLSIHDVNYLYQAIKDNIRMEPFFVLRMGNCYNFVYSTNFTEELLKQNIVQYNLYVSYLNTLMNDQYISDFRVA